MHFLLSTVVKHVLKFKYGWCNTPLIISVFVYYRFYARKQNALRVFAIVWASVRPSIRSVRSGPVPSRPSGPIPSHPVRSGPVRPSGRDLYQNGAS